MPSFVSPHPSAVKARVLALAHAGVKDDSIAQQVRVSLSTVKFWRKQAGISRRADTDFRGTLKAFRVGQTVTGGEVLERIVRQPEQGPLLAQQHLWYRMRWACCGREQMIGHKALQNRVAYRRERCEVCGERLGQERGRMARYGRITRQTRDVTNAPAMPADKAAALRFALSGAWR